MAAIILTAAPGAGHAAAAARFSDLPETHPAHAYVEFLAARGIVNGYPDGRYGPDATLTNLPAEPLTIEVSLTSSYFAANPATAVVDSPPATSGAVVIQAPASAKVGDLITVSVLLQGVTEVKSALISVSHDKARLQATRLIPGSILQGLMARNLMDNNAGRVDYWTATTGAPFSGDGTYYQIEFRVLAVGPVTLQAITPDAKGALWGSSGYMSPSMGTAAITAEP